MRLPYVACSVGMDPSALSPLAPPSQPIKSEFPVNMENLQVNDGNGQSYGYVLYETVISGGGQLNSGDHIRDRAQVKSA